MSRLTYTTFEHQPFGIDDIKKASPHKIQNPEDRAKKFFDSLIDFSQKEDNHLFIRHYKKEVLIFSKQKTM